MAFLAAFRKANCKRYWDLLTVIRKKSRCICRRLAANDRLATFCRTWCSKELTVWRPTLWKVFFNDMYIVCETAGFPFMMCADDINALETFNRNVPNSFVTLV